MSNTNGIYGKSKTTIRFSITNVNLDGDPDTVLSGGRTINTSFRTWVGPIGYIPSGGTAIDFHWGAKAQAIRDNDTALPASAAGTSAGAPNYVQLSSTVAKVDGYHHAKMFVFSSNNDLSSFAADSWSTETNM